MNKPGFVDLRFWKTVDIGSRVLSGESYDRLTAVVSHPSLNPAPAVGVERRLTLLSKVEKSL
jgi:hypothetical protein